MIRFLAATAPLIVLGTLLTAGIMHLARPSILVSALREQHVFPGRLIPFLAALVGLAEFGLGGAGVAITISGRLPSLVLAGAAVLCGVYAAYSWFLLARRPGVSCGCFGANDEVSVWTVLRASALFALGIAGELASVHLGQSATTVSVLTLAAGLGTGLALGLLPAAASVPERLLDLVETGQTRTST